MEIGKNMLLKQNQATEGSPASPLQFNNQDFVKLQNYCLHQGLLFEDDTFPANSYSIGFTSNLFPQEKLRKVQWLRPHALVRNPCLFVDGISRFDILQGQKIGNCWVLAALGALTQQQQFLENVIPKDQGFNHTYAGIFHFQFWYFGNWVDVVIDDRLPFIDGNYLSVHPKSNNEFWPPLLEKAYAKLRGSYEKLHYGFISEALVDLTGGVQLTFNLRSPTNPLFEIMKTAALSGCLMACSTQMEKPGSQVLENGIVQQHVYAVIDATEVPYMYRKEPLIKLWNPWGTVEWNGAWSDDSVEWDQVPQSFKDKLYMNRADGEFWISFEDLKDNFSSLSICNNLPTFLDFDKKSNTTWSLVSYFNQLSPEGSTFRSTLSRNHQYFIKVPEFMTKYNVVVALMQRPANTSQMLVHMGFRLKRGRTIVHDTQLEVKRDITAYYQLKPGDYVITPMTSPQNQELKFLLRIFLRSQDDIRKPNNEFSSETTTMQDMLVLDPDNYESVFLRYASQDSYLDASQLQRILNGVLLKDLTAGLGTGDGFSFDSCKSLLALMDINANGKLSLQQFKRLWRAFKKYEDIFGREDENNSGFLTVSSLRRIVQETGTYVSDKVLQLLVLRYGDSTQRISFPDFVCCMFRLETMAKAFLNLSKNTGSICFTEDEWMTMIMYC